MGSPLAKGGTFKRTGDPTAVLTPAALVIYLAMLGVAVLTMLHRLFGAKPSWRLR